MTSEFSPWLVASLIMALGVFTLILCRLTRCIHAWELVDKTELPSRMETLGKSGWKPSMLFAEDIPSMRKRWVILALRCPKCGLAKIIRESN